MSPNNNMAYVHYNGQAKSSPMAFPSPSVHMQTSMTGPPPPFGPARIVLPTPSYGGGYLAVPDSHAFPGGFCVRRRSNENWYPNGNGAAPPSPVPQYSISPQGLQPGIQFSSMTSYSSMCPPYSTPPSYPVSSASGFEAVFTPITADGLRPIGLNFVMIESGMLDMMTCKELFDGWVKELNGFTSRNSNDLETCIVNKIYQLREMANSALDAARQILVSYDEFASVMDESLQTIRRTQGGQIYPHTTLEALRSQINIQSSALQDEVKLMQNDVLDLAALLSKTKRDANKHTLRMKIWGWLVKVFKAVSLTLKFAVLATPFVDPSAAGAATLMKGGSILASCIAEACKGMEERVYKDVSYDNVVDLLRSAVPESVKRVGSALSAFDNSLLVIQTDMNAVGNEPQKGWIESQEAIIAAEDWRDIARKLAITRQRCQVDGTQRADNRMHRHQEYHI